MLIEGSAFRVPQNDLAFMCTASKVADVLGSSDHPASQPHAGIAFLRIEGK